MNHINNSSPGHSTFEKPLSTRFISRRPAHYALCTSDSERGEHSSGNVNQEIDLEIMPVTDSARVLAPDSGQRKNRSRERFQINEEIYEERRFVHPTIEGPNDYDINFGKILFGPRRHPLSTHMVLRPMTDGRAFLEHRRENNRARRTVASPGRRLKRMVSKLRNSGNKSHAASK